MMYCEASSTVNFKSALAKRREIEGGVLSRRDGPELRDLIHPISRWLHKRSHESRKTVEADGRRSTRVS